VPVVIQATLSAVFAEDWSGVTNLMLWIGAFAANYIRQITVDAPSLITISDAVALALATLKPVK